MNAFWIQERSSTRRLLRPCQQAFRPFPGGFGLWRDGSKSDSFFFLPCRVNHRICICRQVSDSSGPVAVSWAGKQNPWINLLNICWHCLSCRYCLSQAVRSLYLSHSPTLFQSCTKDLHGKCRLLSKVNTTLHSKESGGDSWMSPSPYQESPPHRSQQIMNLFTYIKESIRRLISLLSVTNTKLPLILSWKQQRGVMTEILTCGQICQVAYDIQIAWCLTSTVLLSLRMFLCCSYFCHSTILSGSKLC